MQRGGWVAVAVAGALAVVWLGAGAGTPSAADPDHLLYLDTIAAMRDGLGYHAAMDQGLRSLYGGPVDSVLAVRQPLPFLLWSRLPSAWLLPLLGVACVLSGAAVARLAHPVVGVATTAWLLVTGLTPVPGGWLAQWLVVELWAVPLVLWALVRWHADDDVGAAVLATAAALVRELVVPVLVVGAVVALLSRRRRRVGPWVAGLVVWGAAYLLHVAATTPFLVAPPGAQPDLLGSGSPAAVLGMAAVTGGPLLAVVWVAAVVVAVRRRWWLELAVLWLPLAGLLVDRRYWGLLVVPVALAVVGRAAVRLATAGDGRPVDGVK